MLCLKLLLAGLSLHKNGLDSRPLRHVGTKWHWYRLFSQHFDALQSAPFRHYSIFGHISFNHKAVIKQNIYLLPLNWCGGRYSSDTIATRYGLDDPGIESR